MNIEIWIEIITYLSLKPKIFFLQFNFYLSLNYPLNYKSTLFFSRILRIRRQYPLQSCNTPPTKKDALGVALNWIRWWGSCSVALKSMEYLFIVTIPKSTLTRIGSTYYGNI